MNMRALEGEVLGQAHNGLRVLSVIDKTGDTKTIWDPSNKDEVEAARLQFDALRKTGYIVYRVGDKGKKSEVMNKFDPDAEAMIAVKGVVGG